MPLSQEMLAALQKAIALARREPMPFAFMIGKEAESSTFLSLRTKGPEQLAIQAKAKGEVKGKVAYGTMAVESGRITFALQCDPPAGITKKMKGFIRASGEKLKVAVTDPLGNELGDVSEDGLPVDDAVEMADDPAVQAWAALVAEVGPRAEAAGVDPGLAGDWAAAKALAVDGDHAAAVARGQGVRDGLAAAALAAADRDRWQQAAARLAPMIAEAEAAGFGDLGKIRAVWSFAQGKAAGPKPDFAAAVKSVGMLATLIDAARKAAAAAGAVAAEATLAAAGAGAHDLADEARPRAAAPGGGGGGGGAPAAAPAAAPGGGAAPVAPAAPAPAAAAAAPAAGAAAAPGKSPADGARGTPDEKMKAAEAALKQADDMIAAYATMIPGAAEPVPAEWAAARKKIDDALKPMQPPGAPDAAALDKVLKDLVALDAAIRKRTRAKEDWKRALEVFRLRMVPLDHHAQASANPQVKPKIDAIKAEVTKAEARAAKGDFPGAVAMLAPLPPRCEAVERLADDFAHYAAIETERETSVLDREAQPATGDPKVDDPIRKARSLLDQARADAARDKFADAIRKLDQIPPLVQGNVRQTEMKSQYDTSAAVMDQRIGLINAEPARARDEVKDDLAQLVKDWAAARYDKTKSYERSLHQLAGLLAQGTYLLTTARAAEGYFKMLDVFAPQHALLRDHAGRPGIEAFFQDMDRDRTKAEAEAAARKHATAAALLKNTQPQWAAMQASADAYLAYKTRLDAVKPVVDALVANPLAAPTIQQAVDLLATAATQSLNRDNAGALASVEEAALRAQNAQTAVDQAQAMAGMKDLAALNGIAADYARARAVFDDMKAEVDAIPGAGAAPFKAILDAAVVEADKGDAEAARAAPDWATARGHLDAAILVLEQTQPRVSMSQPFKDNVQQIKALLPQVEAVNIDRCVQPAIDKANRLLAEATALVAAPPHDHGPAEAKLSEARAALIAAERDAADWPAIRAARQTAITARDAVDADPAAAALMVARRQRLDDMVAEFDRIIAAADFSAGTALAATATALMKATAKDIKTVQAFILRRKAWYDDKLAKITPPAPGHAAAAAHLAKAQEKLRIADGTMAGESYDAALTALAEMRWAVDDGIAAVAAETVYEPRRAAAQGKIQAVNAIRNAAVTEALAALETRYAAAVRIAGEGRQADAGVEMDAIGTEADALLPRAQAFKAYDDTRAQADARLAEAEAHPQAAAIQPMLVHLRGKYDGEVRRALTDPAAAGVAMQEVLASAGEALTAAQTAADFKAGADMIAAAGRVSPEALKLMLAAAVSLHGALSAKPQASAAQPDLDAAKADIDIGKDPATVPADAQRALEQAMETLTRAQGRITEAEQLVQAVQQVDDKARAIKAHPEAAYVTAETARIDAEIADARKAAAAQGPLDQVARNLGTTREACVRVMQLAVDQAAYVALRDSPEVVPRLEVLEKHAHRYAIKPQIDTFRARLAAAAAASEKLDPKGALTLLEEAKALGISALVMADMRENKVPAVADLKAILAQPDGMAQIDAMVANLEPDAKGEIFRVAFEARFGTKLDVFQDEDMKIPVAEADLRGLDLRKYFELMSHLPGGDTTNNPSMKKFTIIDDSDGSYYDTGEKQVVMREGVLSESGPYHFGIDFEVGGQDDNCKPANQDPVPFLSWNTLHEVGHAVDDKNGFMDGKAGNPEFGGWTAHGRNLQPVADAIAGAYRYDATYVAAYMAHNKKPALPPPPAGVAAEEWESRRIAVVAHLEMAFTKNDPWASNAVAEKLKIGTRVYHESYPNSWSSYDFAARKKGMTGYQFRAPGEWFSELYAAYHSQKLKPDHPAVRWLASL